MPAPIRAYVRWVEAVAWLVGRLTMFLIFVMIGVLFWSSVSKTFFLPSLWTLEIAQFLMVAYFLLGGAYAMQLGDHVRMDLLYSRWTPRQKAWVDVFTIVFLIFYLFWLLYGGVSSTIYAFEYGERSYSSWRPYMWPVKVVMCAGILLTLLQAIAMFFRDLAAAGGWSLDGPPPGYVRDIDVPGQATAPVRAPQDAPDAAASEQRPSS